MLEKLIELLTALAVATAGLAVASEKAADHDDNGIGWTITEEVAALHAARGLETAAAARAAVGGSDTDEQEAAVDGRAHAAAVLAEVASNAPEQAQAGLTTAITAVTSGGSAAEAPTAGAPDDVPVVTEVPAQVPANVPAPVAAPPVTVAPPTTTPPIKVPGGPPADAPVGGSRP